MSFTEVRQALIRDFVLCVDRKKLPPLSGYLPEYVKSGCESCLMTFACSL